MKFSCDQCSAQYMIADEKVGTRGVKVKCKKCGNIIVVKPAAVEAPAAPLSTPAPGLDSGLGAFGSPFSQPTQTMSTAELASLAASTAPPPDPDLGALGAAAEPAAQPTRAGEKEWYVAIDDAQVGPIDIAEIERRWDQLEIDEESLAWKAGMGDWQPVAEIAELAYLVTERPQKKSKPAGHGAAALGRPAAGSVGAAQADAGWRPSAASALSSLVQDELAGQNKPADSPNLAAQLDMPSFAASDLFGGDSKAGPQLSPAFSAPAPDPFAGAPAWTVPKPRPTSKLKPVHVAFGGMFVLLVGLVGVVAIALLRPGLIPGIGQPPQATPPASNPVPPVTGIERAPGNPPDAGRREEDAEARKTRTKTAPGKAKERAGGEEAEAPRRPDPRKENLDELFDDKPKKEKPPSKPALDQNDVKLGVKKGLASVTPCLKNAMRSGELVPGQKYTLILDFEIESDGSVSAAKLKGPASVLGTSLPACFAQAMRQWDFPSSSKGAPVRNFPLPFTAPQ
ncbi:MAG: zinc-ribbon domain-containing protein [Deltaproteobacteria bacterium]|nr:zinc-ribbon domain-containing protein [Deltaproteobacteria bacterium]